MSINIKIKFQLFWKADSVCIFLFMWEYFLYCNLLTAFTFGDDEKYSGFLSFFWNNVHFYDFY